MWPSSKYLIILAFACLSSLPKSEGKLSKKSFVKYFANCKMNTTEFDGCIKTALNDVRKYFKTGVPELKLPPFDPFFAEEVIQRRGSGNISYILTLHNVTESGWTQSIVTKFRSNIPKRIVQYTQFFPDKYLNGNYSMKTKFMNATGLTTGAWNLTLYDLIQTTTITWPKGGGKLKVRVDVQSIGDLDLHIGNLLAGRTMMENLMDMIINRMWQPGFRVMRPLINDLVSTAFTDIFSKAFSNMDFKTILPNEK